MAKNNSRTKNTVYNFTSSIAGQMLTIVMQFAVRTVFISTLGKSYLGISGLFSNILSMLSLAEFGVGSAILFKLYEPIAHEDHHRIAVLMKFYKTLYRIIGMTVAAIGICLIPFLPKLINDYDKLQTLHINAVIIFLLYLLKSVSSYLFFAYRSSIVKANQKEYLLNIINYVFTFAAGVVQIIVLLFIPIFELYVVVSVFQVIFENFVGARLADKMYPYINQKTDDRIDIKEVKALFKDCAALFLYKLNGVVLKSTDNIVLSVFSGLDMVAMYSNYYVFYTTLNTLFNKIYNSVSHSLGNLHTEKNSEHEYNVFRTVNLITAIIGGTAGVGLFVVADEFVDCWIGSAWLIPQPFSLLMGFEVFTLAMRLSLNKYRTTMGLFQQAKYRPVAGMIINLVVSIALVKSWGICGVLVGTLVSDWTTFMWYDPMIIHRYGFGEGFSVWSYYRRVVKYVLTYAAVAALDYFVICPHLFANMGWFTVIVHAAVIGVTVPTAMVAVSYGTYEYKHIMRLGMKYIKKKKK